MSIEIQCSFCDNVSNTKDHIPSKSLLEKPYPDNLITIPCCKTCNNSFSLDEEYFINVLTEISNNPNLVARKSEGGNVYKARKRSPKLMAKIEESYFQDESGKIYFKAENDRIKKVIEKNALGLFYHRYKKRANIKEFNCTGFYPFENKETRPAEIFMLTYSENFRIKKWNHIQPNVFSYIIVRDWMRNNRLTMIFHIHNTVWCVIEIPYPKSKNSNLKRGTNNNQLRMF